MNRPGESRLRSSLRRLGSKPRPAQNAGPSAAAGSEDLSPKLGPAQPLCLDPSNAFEVAVAEQIKALRDDVDELKDRLNWLFGLIVAAAVSNVVLALLS